MLSFCHFLGCCPLFGNDPSVKVCFLQNFDSIFSGQIIHVQLLLTNQSLQDLILEERLNLPRGWKLLSSNASYSSYSMNSHEIQLNARQNFIQTLAIEVPSAESHGEHLIGYELWEKNTQKIYGKNSTKVIVNTAAVVRSLAENSDLSQSEEALVDGEFPHQASQEVVSVDLSQPFYNPISLRTEPYQQGMPGDILYFGALLNNNTSSEYRTKITPILPENWFSVLPQEECKIAANDSFVQLFGIKIPNQALAGESLICLKLEDGCEAQIKAVVLKKIAFY